ncbi:MAG: AsnC family transcriptional regulator [Nanohaloarchaea archaeon]|nr:AsnC family transcriptional regulator [Candidatus Nanohaloarchaea archaeon]
MDETDRKILEILEEDGRASYTRVAEKIGVSEGTVRNRVERLQEKSVIEKFTVEVSSDSEVSAEVMVELSTQADIDELIENFPSKLKIKELAGEYDLSIELSRSSSEKINEVVDRIRELEDVKSTRTFMIMKKREID